MYFTIAGKRYAICITPRPIIRLGQRRQGWFDQPGGKILICGELPRDDRRRVLFHEARHGWTAEHGLPGDSESDATSVGTFLDSMLDQYEDQGGDTALLALDPPADSVPAGAVARPIIDRAECSCGATVMCGSIHNDPPAWHDTMGCWTMTRSMQCPACDAITVWVEQCSAEGMPLNVFLPSPAPRVMRGSEAAKWLRERAAIAS